MSKTTSKIMDQVSLMSLFEVGAHRGNKKSKLNPRLKKLVFGVDKGMSLIDLVKTKIL
ncbi:MAG: 30S ribosomal protein S2 [Thermales bacterium]|nr:30S ribosomal protein S2 [Thermales bacterium]